MSRDTTTKEQAPNAITQLRAKYLLHRTAIIVTDLNDNDLKQILAIVERNEHPPRKLVQ